MPRALKIAGISLGVVILLPVLLIAALLLFIDPNDYKPEIASVVKDKTDMVLALDDKLEWTLWPSIGVKLGQASLTDPVAKERLVEVGKAAVAVQVMPLLSGQIAIDAVTLDGAKVRFIQHADGSTSWDRMLEKLKSPEESESQKVKLAIDKLDIRNTELFLLDEASNTTRTLTDIAMQANQVDLDKAFPVAAQFVFTQQDGAGQGLVAKNDIKARVQLFQDDERYVLTGLAVTSDLSGNLLPAPVAIQLGGDVVADMKKQLHTVDKLTLSVDYKDPALAAPATVTVTGTVAADMAKQLVNLNGLAINASYPAKDLKVPATVVVSTSSISADLAKTLASVSGLKLQASYQDKAAVAPLTAELGSDISAQWEEGTVSLPNLTLNASYPDKAFPKPLQVSLASAVEGNWKTGKAALPQFVAKALGIEAHGHLSAALPAMAADAKPDTPVLAGMTLNGALATNTFNPRSLMATLGIEAPKTQRADVLQAASLSADIAGHENSIMLKNLKVRLDGSSLSGEAGISDLKSGRQYARLSLDKINVDSYLPPASTAAKPADTAAAKPAAPEALLPVELLRQQNLDVALSIGSLTAMTYPVSNFRVAATANKGVLNVSELKGNIYSGSFSVPATINVQGAQPVLVLKPNLNQVEIGPVLQTLLKQELFTGKASFNGDLHLTGNSTDAWLKSVDGGSGLKITGGTLHGVNMMQLVMDEFTKYQALLPLITGKDAATIVSKQNDTAIRDLAAEATLENGTLRNKTFNADIDKAKLKGDGSLNLLTQEVDYNFSLNLDKSVMGDKYAAYPIPIRCKGNLQGNLAKLCGVDATAVKNMALKAVADRQLEKLGLKGGDVNSAIAEKQQEAEAKVQQKVEEEKQKAQEKINQKLGEGLNKLFKR